jgi:hypothetical protein
MKENNAACKSNTRQNQAALPVHAGLSQFLFAWLADFEMFLSLFFVYTQPLHSRKVSTVLIPLSHTTSSMMFFLDNFQNEKK